MASPTGWERCPCGSELHRPELLAIVRRVIASAKPQPGAILSVGYDGLHDLIAVRGMPDDAFLRAIEGLAPGFRERALGAIAAGTLQLTP